MIVLSAIKPPSFVVNLAFAVPAITPVTLPDASTVATAALSTVHLPVLSFASVGVTDTINVALAPTLRLSVVLSSVTPVTLLGLSRCPIGLH